MAFIVTCMLSRRGPTKAKLKFPYLNSW
ncbi:hypothetical protein NVIE_0882 [Nitrososphaera viennensis EN76]|uniref:Uncharacterized protein n=1 Tax=Nitrososphaera viennensis EN76 TaxID=926571 RepID=A0A060HPE1_9ARCH|nr:hypothetical protein NVIE_0882 [Nitrososphaera viennensis EN76]